MTIAATNENTVYNIDSLWEYSHTRKAERIAYKADSLKTAVENAPRLKRANTKLRHELFPILAESFNYAQITALLLANRMTFESEDSHIRDILYFEIVDIESDRNAYEFTNEALERISRLADKLTARHTMPTRKRRYVWGETPRECRNWIDRIF